MVSGFGLELVEHVLILLPVRTSAAELAFNRSDWALRLALSTRLRSASAAKKNATEWKILSEQYEIDYRLVSEANRSCQLQ